MIAILGGGLAGLLLGRALRERGLDFVVLEGRGELGGLCRTLTQGAHSWDVGPHGFYSKQPEVMRRYHELPLKYLDVDRNVRVCHRDGGRVHEVGYPFENGLADLPLKHRLQCAAGYCAAALTGRPPYAHLRDWIERGLGAGIARHFMLPYNRKIWSVPLESISMDLVSQKIEPESAWKIVRHALKGGSVGRAYQARFIYPTSGGAGAIPAAAAKGIADRIRTGFDVKRLERTGKTWKIRGEGGDAVEADSIVSTIPIPRLLEALGERPDPAFAFNDTLFVAVGVKEGTPLGRFGRCQWVFFAGPEIFYRISLMRNFQPDRPETIVAEITANGPGGEPADPVRRVLDGLIANGILKEEHVAFARAWREPYTYPIQTVGLRAAREKLEARLRGISLLGRMGRWEYVNTDGVFLGVERFVNKTLPRAH